MNLIAGAVIQYLTEQEQDFVMLMSESEISRIAENSFWILVHIMMVHKQRDVLKTGLPGLHKNIEIF